jgi:hypothetical protein
MDSAHIGIDLSDRSANYDVLDAAKLQNMSESQHGNEDSERNSTTVLKPVEYNDAGNQIPFNATDTSTIPAPNPHLGRNQLRLAPDR